MKKQEKNIEWYNNPSVVTWILIGIIGLIILGSQSNSLIEGVSALKLVQNILNHNITYMIMFLYFVALHTKFGKKYFDYSNVLLMLFLFIIFVTSMLTVFQSFTLASLLSLISNLLIFVYFLHTFSKKTRFWKEFKLNKSPFNDLNNEWYFNAIMVVEVTLFAVSLISLTDPAGIYLIAFDCIYTILFGRYIYLYGIYADPVRKENNFDEFKEKIVDVGTKAVEVGTKIIDDSIKAFDNKDTLDKENDKSEGESLKKVEDNTSKGEDKVISKTTDDNKDKKNDVDKYKAVKKGDK